MEKAKPILKAYCDFFDMTSKAVNELLERLDQHCKIIGCKEKNKEPFMNCNKGCPLFYAWQRLDKLKTAMEEAEE